MMASRSNGDHGSADWPFPPIELDTTLYDLLLQDADDGIVRESLCNAKPNSDINYHAIPTNSKYLITSAALSSADDLAHLQLENTSYLLSFWAGAMEVNLVGSEGLSDDTSLTAEEIHQKARTSFSALPEHQRPKLRVFRNAEDYVQTYGERGVCRWGFAVDFAEQVPSFIHPSTMYKLNSKTWLAECPLLSANDTVVECECKCPSHKTMCGQWYYESRCSNCNLAMNEEIDRVRKILEDRKPPFVFKLTQCLGSAGTSLVKTDEDKEELLKSIAENMRYCLPRLTKENAHIRPTSYVVSDFLPGKTIAINFYLSRKTSIPISLGVCHQLGTRAGGRQHTALTWSDQEELEKKYRDTLDQIGKVLHHEGYYGPAGADIMETEDGTQYVIDLNVRTATSLILGLLRGHCKKRSFGACMVFECILLSLSRERMFSEFEKEFGEGRIVLMGTTKLSKKEVWAYPIVLAGEDQDNVKALSERILKFEGGGSQEAEDAGGG